MNKEERRSKFMKTILAALVVIFLFIPTVSSAAPRTIDLERMTLDELYELWYEVEATIERAGGNILLDLMVWVTESGSKYHSSSMCSNMKNPIPVWVDEAISEGYSACAKCWE